jgi:hypothetical protein
MQVTQAVHSALQAAAFVARSDARDVSYRIYAAAPFKLAAALQVAIVLSKSIACFCNDTDD